MSLSLSLLLPFRSQFDHIINSENRNGSLSGEFQHLGLAKHGFEDPSLQVIPDASLLQIESPIFETLEFLILIFLIALMHHLQLGNQLSGVQSSIEGDLFRNHQKSLGELGDDTEVLAGAFVGHIFQIDGDGGLDAASPDDHFSALQSPLENTERVVNRPVHFVQEELVGSSEDERTNFIRLVFGVFDENVVDVAEVFLVDCFCLSEQFLRK